MISNREQCKLKDVCNILGGNPAPKGDNVFCEDGIPFVRMQDLGRYHLTINLNTTKNKLSPECYTKNKFRLIKKGSILLPRSGSVALNHRAILGQDSFIVSHICALEIKSSRILNKYLYYTLCKIDMRKIIKKTTGLDAITFEDLGNLVISLPSLPEQKRIVEIIEKADTLRNKRQEADSFTSDLMNSIFAKTFDNKYKLESFIDIFDIKTGKLNANQAEEGGRYPFFTCSKSTFSINKFAFDQRALILSGNNATAEYSVKYYEGKFNAYQRTYVLSLKNGQYSYKYFQMVLENQLNTLKKVSIGTNTKYLTLGIMKNIKLKVPSIEIQQEFADLFQKVEKIKAKQLESKQELDNLFNSLMQKEVK